jgi:hypothetical protein
VSSRNIPVTAVVEKLARQARLRRTPTPGPSLRAHPQQAPVQQCWAGREKVIVLTAPWHERLIGAALALHTSPETGTALEVTLRA